MLGDRPVAVVGEEKCWSQSLLQFLESGLWVLKSWVLFLFLFSASFWISACVILIFPKLKWPICKWTASDSSWINNAWSNMALVSHWPLSAKALAKTPLRSILSLLSLDFVLYGSFVLTLLSISLTSTCFSEQHPRIYWMNLCRWFLDLSFQTWLSDTYLFIDTVV